MRFLAADELPRLSHQVKALVRDGIYALYEIRADGAMYLVFTQGRAEHYFLSAVGEVVLPGLKLSDAHIVNAVSFSAGGGDPFGVCINCGSA